MIVLACNIEMEILSLWYNNYECFLAFIAKLLAIQKVIMALHNFWSYDIQMKNGCKIAIETLLGISKYINVWICA